MNNRLHKLLFPDNPRPVPHRRLWLNVFRAMHILCFSVYVGGLYFDRSGVVLQAWFAGILLSGLALWAIDLYSSCILLFEVRGVSVMVKILLLLSLPLLSSQAQLWLLMLLLVFSSLASHSSRKIRHKMLLPLPWLRRLGIDAPIESRGTAG